jgi:hypothetical protein
MNMKNLAQWLAFLILVLALPAAAAAADSRPAAFDSTDLLRVTVLSVDPQENQPVVALTDANRQRVLLIWIGFFEAFAIVSEMEGIASPRPLTHELLKRVIQNYDGTIRQIVITRLQENTYYATIELEKNGQVIEIDARPSDSIVMALKFDAPIFVTKTLFNSMAVPLAKQPGIEETYGLTLQNLTSDLADYLSYESTQGVFVAGIRESSRADRDGIEMGDIIVAIQDRAVANLDSIRQELAAHPGPVDARIYRRNEYIILTLHLK